MRRLPLLLLTAALAAVAVPGASADRVPGLQARARHVLAEVNALDRRIERVAEAYNRAGVDLAGTRRRLRVNQRSLATSRRNLATAQRRLARMLVARYKSGDENSTLMVLVGSTSIGLLIDRVDAAERLAAQDEALLVQVRRFQLRVRTERRELRRTESRQGALLQTLRRRRADVESQLGRRRRLLASIRGEVARLQAQERVRQERLRRAAQARLAAAARLAAQQQAQPEAPPAAGAATSSAGAGHPEVVPILMRYLGVPYRWGGASPSTGFDCSGLVLYVYAQIGISLPHNAAMQYAYGTPVARSELLPGDIVFFNDLGHNGIYIGGNQFIDAPKTGDVVKIETLSGYWSANYVGARRLP